MASSPEGQDDIVSLFIFRLVGSSADAAVSVPTRAIPARTYVADRSSCRCVSFGSRWSVLGAQKTRASMNGAMIVAPAATQGHCRLRRAPSMQHSSMSEHQTQWCDQDMGETHDAVIAIAVNDQTGRSTQDKRTAAATPSTKTTAAIASHQSGTTTFRRSRARIPRMLWLLAFSTRPTSRAFRNRR